MAKQKRYCAYCGHHRAIYEKRHVSAWDCLAAALLGVGVASLFGENFDPRGLMLGAIGIGLAEIFIGLRYRLGLICGKCGFDPILYRRDPEQAARQVKERRQLRLDDPVLALAEPGLPVKLNPELSQRFRRARGTEALNSVTEETELN